MEKFEAYKGGLEWAATIITTAGVGMLALTDSMWAGIIVIILGLVSYFGIELLKRYDKRYKLKKKKPVPPKHA